MLAQQLDEHPAAVDDFNPISIWTFWLSLCARVLYQVVGKTKFGFFKPKALACRERCFFSFLMHIVCVPCVPM